MTLIDPVESNAVDAAETEGVTWGVRAVGAMEIPLDGTDVTVAVLDTGIDLNHPGFADVEKNCRRVYVENSFEFIQ